nr:hypothetical protein Iba_chr14aCG4590 [Ipomoea batatas]GMD86961.1 hypothetical protein Iba_chr14bCG11150 [Ipomoea batatas]GMD88169.1 hypothetical protein Iba_chr14cCG4480 [Ipomoea batatas]
MIQHSTIQDNIMKRIDGKGCLQHPKAMAHLKHFSIRTLWQAKITPTSCPRKDETELSISERERGNSLALGFAERKSKMESRENQ